MEPGCQVPAALGSYLNELVAFFAGDNKIVPELVLCLWVLDDGELI